MASERSVEVLRVIVSDYIQNREPVGSKTIADRHGFGVSSATIRNDMAILEDAGLIVAPHTSSGRIPTDKGYRLFVDRFGHLRPLSSAQRRAVESFLEGTTDLDEVLTRAVRSLSQLTNSVAVAQVPSLATAIIHHVEFVRLSERRVLTVVITDSGRVEQRIGEVAEPVDDELLTNLRERISPLLVGTSVGDAAVALRDVSGLFAEHDAELVSPIIVNLFEQVLANRQERFIIAGAANLARTEQDFPSTILPVLEAIEEHVVLLRLFGELSQAERSDRVSVRIGREHTQEEFAETAVLGTGFASDHGRSGLGVIGPTRMDYQHNMAAVRAVARYLSRALGDEAH
ncbi:heat-inducible transcription repressor HrcA [Pseudoclavibacter endophyticus]|uniref:Heat-inducible transcription repressor HrcA n=1 Tax=Pseudoclavibacter endophyticus TaxID=1778590 RepID=A0A6H9WSM8_9MICO|nr:heat-inducible transcriptional repressor HrcA [Pseudoclavibacter endophyticus]KAB1649937.1 heat-inducible transcriptional repressor HrcA [Pseudoclavibacter endophyticus]GGA58587.1 heat-inducible transcription repressor HrcA [Pseudoclavibacter endophyticus]